MRQHLRSAPARAENPEITPALIRLRGLGKSYDTPAGPFPALIDVDLDVHAGDFLAIVGKSGSGKSTLINLLTGIDKPTSGTVTAADVSINGFSEDRMAAWRGRTIGVVFQFFQLLPTLSVVENVMLPMDFCNTVPAGQRRARAIELLARLEIAEHADKLPSDLSGGQQQRAAIARALANDPPVIVADEPTGNLNSKTSDDVLGLFADLAANGKAVVMVTHERDVSRFATRGIELADGRIVSTSGVRADQ